jgi:hypothetical protein
MHGTASTLHPGPPAVRPLRLLLWVGAAAAAAVAVAMGAGPAVAKPKAPAKVRVVFLQPADGPERVRSDESLLGLRTAIGASVEGDPAVDLVPLDLPEDGKPLAGALAKARKDGTALLVASVPDGRTRGLELAARRAKLPLIVLSPEPTRPHLDGNRGTFWAGGVRPVWEALYALDFLLQPLGSRRPIVLHDGSARAVLAAEKCLTLRHVDQAPKTPQELPADFDGPAAAELVDGLTWDGIVYFGGPRGAERLLRAVNAAQLELPVLLGQGLASEAVPTFHGGKGANAWALECAYLEDQQGPRDEAKWALDDATQAAGKRLVPAHVRGFRAGRWVVQALRAAGGTKLKKVLPALQELGRVGAQGKPVFEPWGHASLGSLEPWRSAAVREDPACHRVRHTLMPMAGIPQIGFFPASRFTYEPGTVYVYCTFGEDAKRSIERDLQAIGLHTKGYEVDLEKRVLDDLLGRVMSKMSQKFHRNPDGTAIPGVSYAISFTAKPPDRKVKAAHRWYVIIQGDDPVAGGRASGNVAKVFPTFIQRTMYVQHKLTPPLSHTDRKYMAGRYEWGTSVDENLRGDSVRSLLDGFAGAMGLTGSHELGHIAGCGHDEETPRSIMNVAEGAGLEFEWGEWSPSHVDILEKRLGRIPAR